MIELRFEIDTRSTAEFVFDTIVDLRGYSRWLGASAVYSGTTEISTDPIAVGTTYVEPSPAGVRSGVVTEFEPSTRVTFHQPMTANPQIFGVIDIRVTYTVTALADHVHVSRAVRLELPWQLKLVRPVVVYQIRAESERTLLALKTYTDGRG